MKNRNLLASAIVAVVLSGCASWTPHQKAVAITSMDAAVNATQHVVDFGVQLIAAVAKSDRDLSDKANLLDSAAGGLRSLEANTDGLLTVDLVAGTLRQFTDPSKAHWSDFADTVAAAIVADPRPVNVKLEAFASEVNAKAAVQRAAAAMSADPDKLVTLPTDSQP